MKDYLEARTWFSKIENQHIKIQIFLVNAPLTLGHSQLIACFPECTLDDESERFALVAPSIKTALQTFQQAFGRHSIHNKLELASLTKLTMTDGSYIKTLILRTSANEENNEYKVHLVPYFSSHASSCKKRYTAIHSVNPEETGGLLGWLGVKETIADSWLNESDNPFTERLDDAAEKVLRLSCLKELLAKELPSQAQQITSADG